MEELQKEGSPACAERFGKEKPHVKDGDGGSRCSRPPQLQGCRDEREAVRSSPEGREPGLRSELGCEASMLMTSVLTMTLRRSSLY